MTLLERLTAAADRNGGASSGEHRFRRDSGLSGSDLWASGCHSYGATCKAPHLAVLAACACFVATGVVASYACGGALASVRLKPEEPATLHVGQVAAVQMPPDHSIVGSAGSSLVLVKQTQQKGTTVYLYRAVASGNQTFVALPREPTPDGCVSCVTFHYFVTVIQ
jgi:hypothetical protein